MAWQNPSTHIKSILKISSCSKESFVPFPPTGQWNVFHVFIIISLLLPKPS
jgi:hypothetical protein